jgi:copper resistance protein D
LDDPLIVVRGIHFAATAMTVGVLIFLVLVAERAFDAAGVPDAAVVFRTWSRRVGWAGLAIMVISGLSWVALQASAMSGLPFSEAIAPDVLWILVSMTHFGIVSDIRLALAALLAASLLRDGSGRWAGWLTPTLAAGLIVTIASTGHAAATLGAPGTLHLTADALHVLASAVWIGGLLSLAMLLTTARHHDDARWAIIARVATLRFSNLGIVSVGALLATGIVNGWILVGSLAALVGTDYGRLLILKLALFAAMLSVAAVNRLRLTPQLLRTPSPNQTLRRLSLNCIIEIVIGLAIFAVVAALGTLHPAIHTMSP